jgi:hypothetical protein
VQDKGLFDAPDATVSLTVDCVDPVVAHATVRNIGLASLPAGVDVAIYRRATGGDVEVGRVTTTHALLPGQSEVLTVTLAAPSLHTDAFYGQIVVDPRNLKFH